MSFPRPELKYRVRRGVALVGAGVVVLAIAGWLGPVPTVPVQGDVLGPDGRTRAEYVDFAAGQLEQLRQDSTGQRDPQPRFALVTFAHPLDAQQASAALRPLQRVNALVVGGAGPVPVPEPVAGRERAEVFDTALGRLTAAMGGAGTPGISSVVVYAPPAQLEQVAKHALVAAVEPGLADAVWGNFAVRPQVG
ncbi:hypothetical protein [Corynebacterium lizhenjunii]|uniref:hypothetical protein n=1 Tax=Corynebacterium lizhenjunii TaxID=2709394 RepID=UPI0013EB3F51|nr:hypothetical protein [Corynebacterium lizhenjunii]